MTADPDLFTTFAGLALTARSSDDLDSACTAAATGLGVDGVGVTLGLPSTLRAVIGASNHMARLLEEAQLTAGEGPCTLASRSARTVLARDLTDPAETRWPGFVHQVHRLPVRAVIAVPLTVAHNAIGSLDIHSLRPSGLDDLEPATIDAVAATMNRAILHTQLIDHTRGNHHTNWVAISQATGMVMASLRLGSDDALARLRSAAFLEDRWLTDLAGDRPT